MRSNPMPVSTCFAGNGVRTCLSGLRVELNEDELFQISMTVRASPLLTRRAPGVVRRA